MKDKQEKAYVGLDASKATLAVSVGGNYVPVVREAFNLLASGTQAFTGGDRGRSMVLQCNLAFSVFWLVPRLHRLYEANPWLVLNIVTPIWDPERHAANAAMEIRFGRPEEMSNAAERLTQETYFPVCSPNYQDGQFNLDSATLFDCAGVTGSWNTWTKSSSQYQKFNRNVNLASTYVIAMQASRNGAGIAMSHDTLAKDSLDDGSMVCPFDHRPALTDSYFLLTPSEHMSTPATREFQNWMQSEMK